MRSVQNSQFELGELDIAQIKLDPRSRADIPRILRGLQHLYMNEPLRESIFSLLEKQVAPTVSKGTGRPGMALWKIVVCGVVRLDLNIDYDRLHELVNKHIDIRGMLGHGTFNDERYSLQMLKDNLRLLTPELLDEINELIVNAGHVLVKKKKAKPCLGDPTPLWLKQRCTFQRILICFWMPCAKSLHSSPRCAKNTARATGDSLSIISGT